MKQIRDQTDVKIDIPKRDAAQTPTSNGPTNGTANGITGHDDEDEEILVPIKVSGPQPMVLEAQVLLKEIIASKRSKSTQRIRDIPEHVLPFILVRKTEFLAAGDSGSVNLSLNAATREITATGDREAVGQVVEAIKQAIEELGASLTSVTISLPKRQHRLLTGANADAIMNETNCTVLISKPEGGDGVVVWGKSEHLPLALGAVMTKANSKYIHEMPLPGPMATSKQLATYFSRIQYAKTLNAAHPSVEIYLPSPDNKANSFSIDLVGDKPAVDAAIKQIAEFLGRLIGATKSVSIDWLVHRVINGKNAKKCVHFTNSSNH